MRQSFLQFYNNIIPVTQQKRLLDVLQKSYADAGIAPTEANIQIQLAKLIAQLDQPLGTPLVKYRKAEKYSKISSQAYNNTMGEIYVDLGALFKQDNLINKTMIIHRTLNDSVLTDSRAALRKIENNIEVLKILKKNKSGVTDAIYNNFYKNDNQSTIFPYVAWLDSDVNSLKLPLGVDHSALSINGLAVAEISVSRYGGGIRGTLGDESHNTKKAIDGDSRTFWGEVILTDEPVRQIYEGNTVFGIVCEIVITFLRPESINHVRFNPYTKYPLNILKVLYRAKTADSWIDLGFESQSSTGIMEFNFSEVYAKEVMIVINQQNVSVNTYKIPRRVINNAELWQQIADREYSITTVSTSFDQNTQDMIDYTTGWRAYVDATNNYTDKLKQIGTPKNYIQTSSISESIFDATTKQMLASSNTGANSLKMNLFGTKDNTSQDELVEVRKYEYIYGAYEIDIKKLWYIDTGEYIGPQFISKGPIVESMLDCDFDAPDGTTVEFQLATRSGEWKNIFPSGVSSLVLKERLDVDPITYTGELRFPASGSITSLYRDNDLISGSSSYTMEGDNDVIINPSWYSALAIYTVSYTPAGMLDAVPSGVSINFINDSLLTSVETFDQLVSRQYEIDVEHFPFVDYRIINDTSEANESDPDFSRISGRWLNISINTLYGISPDEYYDPLVVKIDGYDAENRTDYYKNERPALTPYNLVTYPNFEYFQNEKRIYFNTPLNTRNVKITYFYLNDYIQMRALLRNNLKSRITLTPVLYDYTIRMRTI